MRPNRTPPTPAFALAALAALVSGCVDELETGLEPPGEEGAAAGTALAAGGDPPWDGGEPGEPDSIVDPARGRIDLTISTPTLCCRMRTSSWTSGALRGRRSTAARWC